MGGRKSGAVLTGYLGLSFASDKRHCQKVRQPRLRHPVTLSGSNCLPPHRGRARHNFIFRIKVSQLMCQIYFDPVTGLWCYFRHFRSKKWGLFWLKHEDFWSDWVQKHLICLCIFETGRKICLWVVQCWFSAGKQMQDAFKATLMIILDTILDWTRCSCLFTLCGK